MTDPVAVWLDPDGIRLDVDDGTALACALRARVARLHDERDSEETDAGPVSRFANST